MADKAWDQVTTESGGKARASIDLAGIGTLRLAILGVLLVCIGVTAALAARYVVTRQPVQTSLPDFIADNVGTPHYQYSIYGVNDPLGVAVSPDGNRVYVVEGAIPNDVVVFDRSGKELARLIPSGQEANARTPVYVSVNGDKVYVTDRLRHAIDIYDHNDNYLGAVEPPDKPEYWSPLGIGFDKDGKMLVTDVTKGLHRLMVLDAEGKQVFSVGDEGKGDWQYYFPNGVTADSKGRIYVADGNNGRVKVLDAEGNLLFIIKNELGLPRGLAVDDHFRRLYVVDTSGNAVAVYDISEEPTYLYSLGDQGTDDGQFNYPNGIATDDTGRIYVADRVNQRVQVWIH